MTDINVKLLKQLECPICLNYMTKPIILCSTGHSLCYSCSMQLTQCGLCKKPLSTARNYALESLSLDILLPCPNDGCEETKNSNELKQHLKNCQYRNYKCLYTSCHWSGQRDKIVNHFENSHQKPIEEREWLRALHLKQNKKIVNLFMSENLLYFCTLKVAYPNYYFHVQYVGPPQEAKLHRYEIKLGYLKERRRQIILQSYCQSLDLTDDELLNENGTFCFDWKIIETLLSPDGSFRYSFYVFNN